MPILNKAKLAVEQLKKTDIDTIKAYANPPELVQKVVHCVMTYLGQKNLDWKNCKEVMVKDLQS